MRLIRTVGKGSAERGNAPLGNSLLRFAATSLAAAMLLAGCGGARSGPEGSAAGPGTPRKGGVLQVATIGNPPTLDIHISTTAIVEQVTFNLYETLFALDSKFLPRPMLADSYQWENGQRRLVIKLRTGVLFHNGQELTAADAAASIGRWLRLSALGKQIAPNVAEIKAADAHTMTIDLKAPMSTLVAALANPNNEAAIMPKAIVDAAGDKPLAEFVGTGPYKLAEFAQDRYVRLTRWEQYVPRAEPADGYAGKKEALLDEIDYIPVSEAQTREAGLQSGQYHFAFQIPQDHYQTLKGNAELDMLMTKPAGWTTLVFNKQKGPFTDVRLRQAVNWSLDPGAIMKAAYGDADFYRLDPSLAPKEGPYWSDIGNDRYNKRSLEKARALLAEAGYDGRPIRLLTTKEYDYQYKTAVVAKQQMEEAGFKVDMQVVDWATLVQRRANPDLYDIFTTAILFSPLPTAENVFLSPAWPGWWQSTNLQQHVDAFNAEVDPARQKAQWDEVQRVFWEEIPVIHLGDYFNLHAKRRELKGYQSMPNVFFWNTWLEP
ncbi:MAG: peptide transporter [Firmicutes bacterium]|nr:peptide transporter [Bacillota bacterium]